MTQKSQYQPIKQGIATDKNWNSHQAPANKKYPYPSIIAQITQKVKHKINKPLEPGLKLPKNYEIKAIKLTTLALTTFLITLLASSILTPVQPSRATEVLSALQTTNGTVSLTTSASAIDLSLTAGSAGAVRTAMDTVTVTSSATGYQLYLSTASSTNALIRDGATSTGTDSTTGLPTYASSDTIPATSTTSLSTPAVLPNDTWGFAVANTNTTSGSGSEDVIETANFGEASTFPTGDDSVATSKFAAVPTAGSEVLIAKRTSTASAVPTNVYYGIRATSAKPSGLYKNTIIYTAIGDGSVSGLASVSPNRTNNIQGGETLTITTPSTLDLSSIAGTSVTVGGEACTNSTATKASDNISVNITCTSPALATGWHEVVATITTTAGSTDTYVVNPGIEYYYDSDNLNDQVAAGQAQTAAIIAINNDSSDGVLDLSNTITMQQMSAEVCNAMKLSTATSNANKAYTLKDSRDGKTYNIAKLDDGLCWMVSNLRLGEANTEITLTSSDSDVSTDTTIPASAIVSSGTTSWSGTVDAWHAYVQSDTTYGNLYNWYTATASTGTSDMKSSSVTSTTDASSSICPKGWKLPNGGNTGTGSFQGLIAAASIGDSSSTLNSAPYSFTYAGNYYSGPSLQGSHGRYWSSSASYTSVAYAYLLSFHSDSINSRNSDNKYTGSSVRCTFTGSSFQNFTLEMCNNLETGKTITLYDNRDGNVYTVAKLGDNNCWQTQNMRLGATPGAPTTAKAFTLTRADSNVSLPFSVTTSNIQNSGSTSWSGTVYEEHIYLTGDETYGNYYNWYTATAGTGKASITSGDAYASICPSSGTSRTYWKLPPNTGNGSYTTMFQSSGVVSSGTTSGDDQTTITDAIQAAPYSLPLAGNYGSGVNSQAYFGQFWSRSTFGANAAYQLRFNRAGFFRLQDSTNRYHGASVRCVLVTSE